MQTLAKYVMLLCVWVWVGWSVALESLSGLGVTMYIKRDGFGVGAVVYVRLFFYGCLPDRLREGTNIRRGLCNRLLGSLRLVNTYVIHQIARSKTTVYRK